MEGTEEKDLLTVEELRDYLGVDSDCDHEVAVLLAGAVERLNSATGRDWRTRADAGRANEALRVMVYISYYGVRDEAKNTQFLSGYLNGILCELQLAGDDRAEE